MTNKNDQPCPDCDATTRRDFLQIAGGMALAGGLSNAVWAGEGKRPVPENKVTELYQSLSTDQKKGICFPVDHEHRTLVTGFALITDVTMENLKPVQLDLAEKIFKGMTSEEGYDRFTRQMKEDSDGMKGYSISFFGEPGDARFEFVLSGRHVTQRVDGNFDDRIAFGGTMFYGHASEAAGGFHENKTHKGNVFWYQALEVNKVFQAFDATQRQQVLLGKAPHESEVEHRQSPYPGLKVAEMSVEQQKLVQKTLMSMLRLYRQQDIDEALKTIKANGGLGELSLSFYQQQLSGKLGDIGNDGVWELWRLEGPGFAWHYRGNPHPHGWVNIAKV